jgi:hypothetical protein
VRIGDDYGDLDDPVPVRVESGHLHVQPNEIILILSHVRSE